MVNRLFSLFLILAVVIPLILTPNDAIADDTTDVEENASGKYNLTTTRKNKPIIDPKIARRNIDESLINVDDFELGVFFGGMNIEDFGTNSLYGLSLAYHINENFFTKVHYGQSTAGETSFERLSGGSLLLTPQQRELTYYDVSVGYNLNGETFVTNNTVFNSSLYAMIGAGSTEFGSDDRFTINLGVGYRIILSDYFTVHIDMTDHIFDNDVLGLEQTTHNLSFTTGISLFF